MGFAKLSTSSGGRNQCFDVTPLLIGQVTRISPSAGVISPAVFRRPPRHLASVSPRDRGQSSNDAGSARERQSITPRPHAGCRAAPSKAKMQKTEASPPFREVTRSTGCRPREIASHPSIADPMPERAKKAPPGLQRLARLPAERTRLQSMEKDQALSHARSICFLHTQIGEGARRRSQRPTFSAWRCFAMGTV